MNRMTITTVASATMIGNHRPKTFFIFYSERSRSIRGRPSYASITWLAQEVFPDTPSLGSLRLWRDAEASRTLVALPKLPHGRVRRLDMPAKPVRVEQ